MNASFEPNSSTTNDYFGNEQHGSVLTPKRGMQTVTYLPEQLDENSLSYLRDIHSKGGVSFGGWYLKCNPYGIFIVFFVLIAMVVGGGVWEFALQKDPGHPVFVYYCQRVYFIWSTVLCILAGYMLIYRNRPGSIGEFQFVDALFYWNVSPFRVKVTRIDTAESAQVTHQYWQGSYAHSRIKLHAPEGNKTILVNSLDGANTLLRFINSCIQLKERRFNGNSVDLQADPTLRGAIARQMADHVPETEWNFADIRPIAVPAGSKAPLLRSEVRIGIAAALVSIVFTFTYFPAVVSRFGQEWDFAGILAKPDNLKLLTDYMKQYPQGRHIDRVKARYDNGLWKQARLKAEQVHSPKELRAYLAVPSNTRHRDEATRLIGVYYDEAIARIKESAAAGKDVDPTVVDAMIAILIGLKNSQDSIVTVGFKPVIDPLPTTPELQRQERQQYEVYRKQFGASFAALEQASPDQSAICPLGEVFDPAQLHNREDVILQYLWSTLGIALPADIIRFKRVSLELQPQILCNYSIANSGSLYPRTSGGGQNGENGPLTLNGVYRVYHIGWNVTFRPRNSDKIYEKQFGIRPASSLRYRAANGDPNWAPYAIMMHSAFHDFAVELVRGFGMNPPRQPNTFSFREATGTDEGLDDGLFPEGIENE